MGSFILSSSVKKPTTCVASKHFPCGPTCVLKNSVAKSLYWFSPFSQLKPTKFPCRWCCWRGQSAPSMEGHCCARGCVSVCICVYTHIHVHVHVHVCVCALVFGVKGRGERLVSNVYSSIVSMKQHIKARKDGWMAGPWRLAKTSAFAYIATQEHHLACLAR